MPTRNKPEEIIRVCSELSGSECRLWLYVADDDPKLSGYQSLRLPSAATIVFGPPLGFSRGVNHLASIAAKQPNAKMLMRAEDDFYFKPGWDRKYREAMWDDGVGMVWCNYVMKGPESEPHTAAIGLGWYHALGWFSLPGVQHYYCDNVLREMAEAVGRSRYIPEPMIEHRYNPKDLRKCGHGQQIYDSDKKRYDQWQRDEKAADCGRIFQAGHGKLPNPR